jgi:hypothetical protein
MATEPLDLEVDEEGDDGDIPAAEPSPSPPPGGQIPPAPGEISLRSRLGEAELGWASSWALLHRRAPGKRKEAACTMVCRQRQGATGTGSGEEHLLLRAPPVVVESRRKGRTPAPTNVQRRLNLQCKCLIFYDL